MGEVVLKVADEKDRQVWDGMVDATEMGTVFHKMEWLKAAEKHTKSKLYPLIGYEGSQVVSLFPIFYMKKAFVKMTFSPPPYCAIPCMGPIFRYPGRRQSSIENLHNKIVEKVLHFLIDELHSDYIQIKTQKHLLDIRPFLWASLDACPNYTYMVPLEPSKNCLYESFSNEMRVHIRKAEKEKRLQFRKGDEGDFKILVEMTMVRYREQGKTFGPSFDYLMKIYESFPDNVDVASMIYDDEIVGGLILIKYGEVVAHWLGGITPVKRVRGANELLHWWVIQEYKEQGYKHYELIGANTKHLCRFKSKFNPTVNLYFSLTRKNHRSRIAESLYDRLRAPAN